MKSFENNHKGEGTLTVPSPLIVTRKEVITMRGEFSFCGIDIADLGIGYAPENKDTYIYKPAKTNIYEEVFDGHNGGYFFGASKQPKEFILRCYYENSHIAKGLMAKIYSLFKVGKSGKLIFKRRPWCYYYATVTDFDDSTMYNYMNGLFVITMKAYYPFARGVPVYNVREARDHYFFNTVDDVNHYEIMANTGILEKESMVPTMSFNSIPNNNILLYNPGTERANVGIVFKGTCGDGITIHNLTTDQKCRYVGFETRANEDLFTDGINGKTVIREYNNHNEVTNSTIAFLYHDYGFIELEPSFPVVRNLFVSYDGTLVTSVNILFQDGEGKDWYKGKYIFLNNNWYKIAECVSKNVLLLASNAGQGSEKTTIVTMNEIEITGSPNTNITKISFEYKPTYA